MDVLRRYLEAYRAVIKGGAAAAEVDAVLSSYAVVNESYRQWLIASGGGPIGPNWYDGINELPLSQEKLKEEPWRVVGFAVGWDGAGNPIVLSHDGRILTEDHNFGGIHVLAESFDELLTSAIS